jgi:diguanylate cyclase (GGDEF)-like protein
MRSAWSRKWGYPLIGAALAFGCPLGLLVVQALVRGRLPSPGFISAELHAQPVVYAYTTFSLLLLMTALGWVLGRHEDNLQAGSLTDPLTGLWNRRQLATRLQEEMARAVRHRTPLSFLLVDVDRLKQLNDRAGHQAGDEALRRVADAIRRSCRRSDVAARYGGDEFAVLAPSTAGSDAAALAERIRAAVREDAGSERNMPAMPTMPTTPAMPMISVSIGVADLTDLPAIELQHELYAAADRALYLAKARGRDQVARAGEVATDVDRLPSALTRRL